MNPATLTPWTAPLLRRKPGAAMRLRIRRNRGRRYTRGQLSSVSPAYLCVLAARLAAI